MNPGEVGQMVKSFEKDTRRRYFIEVPMALRLGNNQTDSEKYLRSFESSFRLYTFHSKKNEYPPRALLEAFTVLL